MAKKNKKREDNLISVATEDVAASANKTEPTVYETEAYGVATPDTAIDTTVTKVIGTGGPVPIVAPKHTTVQLQPIIVPLAVVPYMTSDSDILHTERGAEQTPQVDENGRAYATRTSQYPVSSEAAEFERIDSKKKATSTSARKRAFGAVMFVLGAVLSAMFLIAYFKPELFGAFSLKEIDAIGKVMRWASGAQLEIIDMALAVLLVASFAGSALLLIGGFVTLCFAKFGGAYNVISALFAWAPALTTMIVYIAKKTLDSTNTIALATLVGVSTLALLLGIIFAFVNRKKEDDEEEVQASQSAVI